MTPTISTPYCPICMPKTHQCHKAENGHEDPGSGHNKATRRVERSGPCIPGKPASGCSQMCVPLLPNPPHLVFTLFLRLPNPLSVQKLRCEFHSEAPTLLDSAVYHFHNSEREKGPARAWNSVPNPAPLWAQGQAPRLGSWGKDLIAPCLACWKVQRGTSQEPPTGCGLEPRDEVIKLPDPGVQQR